MKTTMTGCRRGRTRVGAATLALVAGLLALGATGSSTASPPAGTPTAHRPAAAERTAEERPVWLCRPKLKDNPCEIPLDTTVLAPDGSVAKVKSPKRKKQGKRPVDCFYVYPTVSNQVGVNTTKSVDPELRSIAKYQAARFSRLCRVYAPVYRQAPLAGLATIPAAIPTAYEDVVQAWRYYLKHRNKGRGVVLVSHSQGTLMLRKLVRQEIDPSPQLRRQLVGAFLMGGNMTVAAGKTTGGDFANIPLCTAKGEAGCVVAYSTYSNLPPTTAAFFGNSLVDVLSLAIGHPTGPGYQVACTDPAPLAGRGGAVPLTIPTEPFAQGIIRQGINVTARGQVPTAGTTWVSSGQRYGGGCRDILGAQVYVEQPAGGAPDLMEFPPTWGTHLVDLSLGADRLVRIARLQMRTWRAGRS